MTRWKATFPTTVVTGCTWFAENGDHGEWHAKHCVVNVIQGASMPAALGSAKTTRITGMLVAQIFVKEHDGTKTFTDAADAIAAAFDNQIIRQGNTSIHFETAALVDAGTRAAWHQKNVVVPFKRDTYN